MTTSTSTPAAPGAVGEAGRRLWNSVVAGFDLDEHELCLLREAVHVADTCEQLQQLVDEGGLLVDGRVNASLVELRQQRILLARLIVAIRVPLGAEDDQPGDRLQRRGLRGVYGIRGGAA